MNNTTTAQDRQDYADMKEILNECLNNPEIQKAAQEIETAKMKGAKKRVLGTVTKVALIAGGAAAAYYGYKHFFKNETTDIIDSSLNAAAEFCSGSSGFMNI